MNKTLIDAALLLAFTRNVPVFPLRENKRPAQPGGFKTASRDPAEIERMFRDPLAFLIGVPCGPASGIDAVDVDTGRGGLEWLQDNGHRLPVTERHPTRSGGWHLLLAHTPGMRTCFDRIAPGVEVRGDGGYIVWWPSHGAGPVQHESVLSAWPDWLLIDALRHRRRAGTATANLADLAPPSASWLVSLLQAMPNPADVTRGDYVAVNLAVQGAARALDHLDRLDGTDPDDIREAAAEWSSRWQGPTAGSIEDELDRWENDWSTRENDISGARQLLGWAERFGLNVAPWSAASTASEFGIVPGAAPAPPPARATDPDVLPAPDMPDLASLNEAVKGPTETDVAAGLVKLYAGKLVYCHTAARWHLYDGAAWREDQAEIGRHIVSEYVAHVRSMFNGETKLAGASFIRNVESLARSHPALSAHNGMWDRDPWLLGTPGGVVDLRTGRVIPGAPGQFIRRLAGVAPSFEPPTVWLAFLDFVTNGDADFVAFLQRWMGYGLTGDVSEEALCFFYGEGGRGKGTFLMCHGLIMGDYGYQAPAELGETNSRVNPEYQRANLPGRRVMFLSETKKGARLDERQIKELTGNEGMINARHPAGRPFQFRSEAKIAMVSNYEPRLDGRSSAMERRLRVVPFDRPVAVMDSGLKARLRTELPRILGWAIQGCLAWQRQGLGTCATVQRATAAYFEDQDVFGRWASERTQHGAGLRANRTEMLADYTAWARHNGEPAMSSTAFYEECRRQLGATDKPSNGVRWMLGVGLRSANSAAEEFGVGPVSAADLTGFSPGRLN